MSADHRQKPRFNADLPVDVLGTGDNRSGHLLNISETGAAIEFEPALGKPQIVFEIGDSVDLNAVVAPQSHHATRGVVVRSDAHGIAVKFDKPEEDLLAEIVSAVRKMIERDGA